MKTLKRNLTNEKTFDYRIASPYEYQT